MKKLLVLLLLFVASIATSSAQERIDKLLDRDISEGTTTMRMAVKRDPTTGDIIKRVKEFTTTGDRSLAKEFIQAFEAERDNADGWEENRRGNVVQITAVWRNPKRIYTLTSTGATLVVYAQTIYDETTEKEE